MWGHMLKTEKGVRTEGGVRTTPCFERGGVLEKLLTLTSSDT